MKHSRYQETWWLAVILVLGVAVSGCGEDSLRGLFVGYTPHERYEQSLKRAGLDETALGRDWIAAADQAVANPVPISSPYHEVSYLDSREAHAVGYSVELRRGQMISARFESDNDTSYQVFLDMFVIPSNSDGSPRLLASADSLEHELEYTARRDGEYIVRVQPELLRGGSYEITVIVGASLAFPVHGHDTTAIRSWFGDPRSGGAREHHGVDIFAPRGTPVIAAAKGRVRSTRPNNLGGLVVWLRDELGRSLYYAHLDSQTVRRGDLVDVGDTIGFVGNSGNARTTPPHLHFGMYWGGPSDPYPAIKQLPSTPAQFSGDQGLVGGLARVARGVARVREEPRSRSRVLAELPVHTPLRILGGTGGWYRVNLPDGTLGFVAANLTEPADRPIRSEVVAEGGVLRSEPESTADPVESLSAGSEVPVLGAYRGFLYVQAPSGRAGWLSLD
ncbi:MAG: M23 family metallopeptidase [Gemmatimonadota bacterium]|nr:MAG: M23 family metallopeptidase [Gemmatimonadota bacterium]